MSSSVRHSIAALALSLSMSSVAFAQDPFEPVVGQAGKDVVWVPTPASARREDARCRQGDAEGLRDGPRLGRRS